MKNRLGILLFILIGCTGLICCEKDRSIYTDIYKKSLEQTPDSLASHLPVIKDSWISLRTPKEAFGGFTIADDGGGTIISKGMCWSTSKYPTTIDEKDESYSTHLVIDHVHIGYLEVNTTYYIRAYARNSIGTAYSDQLSLTTPVRVDPVVFDPELTYGSVTDPDGNTYKTVQIGTQTWMAENLKTTRYNDGSPIYHGNGGMAGSTDWFHLGDAYCWFDNDSLVFKEYGAIYNWHAVSTGKLCPSGWHVPNLSDWTTLVTSLDGVAEPFNEITENGGFEWRDSEININKSGFNPVYGGVLIGWGFLAGSGTWWSSVPRPEGWNAYCLSFQNIAYEPKSYGFNVRCLKN